MRSATAERDCRDPVWLDLPEPMRTGPRSKQRRLHDALNRLLARYLEAGLGGISGKNPVQVSVTLPETAMTGAGGLSPQADSGALIPRSVVRRWWCDAAVTAFVLSLGGKTLRAIHGQRTITALERRALHLEAGAACGVAGCPHPPDLLQQLVPHHARRFADDGLTALEETVWLCEHDHHNVHEGRHTLLLRDGRYLDEQGFTRAPRAQRPPF
jgi:hypothetical protein